MCAAFVKRVCNNLPLYTLKLSNYFARRGTTFPAPPRDRGSSPTTRSLHICTYAPSGRRLKSAHRAASEGLLAGSACLCTRQLHDRPGKRSTDSVIEFFTQVWNIHTVVVVCKCNNLPVDRHGRGWRRLLVMISLNVC